MGITYFNLSSPYEGDRNRKCSLSSGEIDDNFYFLRGYDIEDGIADKDRQSIVLTRVNGDEILIPVDEFLSNITDSGSCFDNETGILHLNLNGIEIPISGFSTCDCEELISKFDCLMDLVSSQTQYWTESIEILEEKVAAFEGKVEAEKERAEKAEEKLTEDLEAEKKQRHDDDNKLLNYFNDENEKLAQKHDSDIKKLTSYTDDIVKAEKERAIKQETILSEKIATETSERIKDVESLNSLISDETTNRENSDKELQKSINANAEAISKESKRALAAESTLTENLNKEISRAEKAEKAIKDELDKEIARATDEDKRLDSKIDSEISSLRDDVNDAVIEIEGEIKDINGEIESINNVLDNHTATVESCDKRVTELQGEFTALNTHTHDELTKLSTSLTKLEDEHDSDVKEINKDIVSLSGKTSDSLSSIEKELDVLNNETIVKINEAISAISEDLANVADSDKVVNKINELIDIALNKHHEDDKNEKVYYVSSYGSFSEGAMSSVNYSDGKVVFTMHGGANLICIALKKGRALTSISSKNNYPMDAYEYDAKMNGEDYVFYVHKCIKPITMGTKDEITAIW